MVYPLRHLVVEVAAPLDPVVKLLLVVVVSSLLGHVQEEDEK